MRKSIFDIAKESINIKTDAIRIDKMAYNERNMYFDHGFRTIEDCVSDYCFEDWPYRGHCISLYDFEDAIEYDELLEESKKGDITAFISLVEFVYNLWKMAENKITHSEKSEFKWRNNFYHLKDVMDNNLEKMNHKVFFDDERVLIIEDKPEVTAVAEIVEPDLSLDIIRYNHHSLRDEIELKKAILLKMGSDLEPRRKELSRMDSVLCDNIFYMLNNLNLRHNNRSKKSKNYKEYVAKMKKERLEKWYDELYQMMLLAFLLLDNEERSNKVKELKLKIEGMKVNE